jgi:hypothetical protein
VRVRQKCVCWNKINSLQTIDHSQHCAAAVTSHHARHIMVSSSVSVFAAGRAPVFSKTAGRFQCGTLFWCRPHYDCLVGHTVSCRSHSDCRVAHTVFVLSCPAMGVQAPGPSGIRAVPGTMLRPHAAAPHAMVHRMSPMATKARHLRRRGAGDRARGAGRLTTVHGTGQVLISRPHTHRLFGSARPTMAELHDRSCSSAMTYTGGRHRLRVGSNTGVRSD